MEPACRDLSFEITIYSRIICARANRKSKGFWKGCKPNSVFILADGENHLSQQPIPGTRPAFARPERAAPGFPIWPCTRWGFPCRVACASRGALLPHLFTLAGAQTKRRRFDFLWHCPSESFRPSARVYLNRTGLSYAASRPLVFGLSSPLFPAVGCTPPFAVRETSKTGFQPANGKSSGAILRPSKTMGKITDGSGNLKGRIPVRTVAGASSH